MPNDNTKAQDLLPVIQEDRDAAAAFIPAMAVPSRGNVKAGKADHLDLVQAFASHRLRTRYTPPADAGDVTWLIERRVTPPQWSTVRDPTGAGAFYSDPHRAHRFPTKAEAEEAMRRMSITAEERGQYFVSEHAWIGTSPSAVEDGKPCENCGFLPEKAGQDGATNTAPALTDTNTERSHG